jgi:hypothetical protein
LFLFDNIIGIFPNGKTRSAGYLPLKNTNIEEASKASNVQKGMFRDNNNPKNQSEMTPLFASSVISKQ